MAVPAQKSYRDYKDLIAYQKAKENSIKLLLYYKSQKLGWTEKFLIMQLLRAMSSIGANIAEGYGRHHQKDYRRFLGIARGSCFEVEHWINVISDVRRQDGIILKNCLEINTEIAKILTALMKKLQQ